MMQQAYKKGKIVNHWGRKIVFVLQDCGLKYIKTACDTTRLQPYNEKMPIDFVHFRLSGTLPKIVGNCVLPELKAPTSKVSI
jgi:hypothetical protein